jgi:hypothetical protein
LSVYVDDVRHRFGRMIMCHLWADSLDELFAMVDKIGVQRKWIQGHPNLSIGKAKGASWLHFDISTAKKTSAIAAGAVLTDKYGPLEFLAKRAIASGDPARVAAGEAKLEQIAKCRTTGKAA